jgi:hypothetical protein
MTTNPERIVARVRKELDRLIDIVENMDVASDLVKMESTILRGVLELGRLLIVAFLARAAVTYKRAAAQHRSGKELPRHSERKGRYQTVFGTVCFSRSYYCGEKLGHYEMDAALNLPADGPSDFLRSLLERLALKMSYEDAGDLAADYFPISKSTRGVQNLIDQDSQDAKGYYEQAARPVIAAAETILVVQADGKGVPMVLDKTAAHSDGPETQPGRKRAGPGREGKKKMATVVTVATYAPQLRTAQQIVNNLFDKKTYEPTVSGHSFKRVWATMQGKDAAIAQSKIFVEQTSHAPIEHRVLLTDGERALKDRFRAAYPGLRHVLDLLHVLSYLWLGAEAQFGGNTASAKAWVRGATLRLLEGGAPAVVEELYRWAEASKAPAKYHPIETAARYLDGNLESMRYDEYLAKGWPIATGMVEGACRHVVKDRCERSGQRWTARGVEGMLRLRCVAENGDWDAYHAFRIRRRHKVVYGRTPEPLSRACDKPVYQFVAPIAYAEAA